MFPKAGRIQCKVSSDNVFIWLLCSETVLPKTILLIKNSFETILDKRHIGTVVEDFKMKL
jgi:hypothetical protein